MSYLADVEIDGVDVLNTYNMRVTNIQGAGPIQPVKRDFGFTPGALRGARSPETFVPRKLTLTGTISSDSLDANWAMNDNIEAIGALVGWYGDRYKESILTVHGFSPNGSHTYENMNYIVVIESFDIDYITPVFTQGVCKFKMSFRVIGIKDAANSPTQTLPFSGSVPYAYFEASDSLHGSKNVLCKLEAAGGSITYPLLCCIATSEEFTNHWGTATTTGTHPVVEGTCGLPAINFAAAGNNTLKYATASNFPVQGTSAISVFIRFKRNYTIGDSSWHVLLGDGSGLSQTFIAISDNATSDIIWANGTNSVSVSGAGVSSSFWNTLVATSSLSGMTLRLGSLSAEYGSFPGLFPDPGISFYIGTASAGNYRSDCIIDEVAIWKHPLPEAAIIAAVDADFPVRDMYKQRLKTRLSFLQDFRNGFQAIANRGTWLSLGVGINNTQLVIDSDRHTVKLLDLSDYSVSDYIAHAQGISSYGSMFPVIEQYNKLRIMPLGTATQKVICSYESIRRL